MKKTSWYPANIKPVHIGVYETDLVLALDRFGFSYWDGSYWGNQFETPERAEVRRDMRGAQDKPWRGLKDPA